MFKKHGKPLVLLFGLSPFVGEQNFPDHYPKLYQEIAYEPYHHTVRKGEDLWTIAEGYFGYLIPMVVEETGEHPNLFIHGVIEQIGRDNDIDPSEYHKIYTGQKLLMPRVVEDNCADYVVQHDWHVIDTSLSSAVKKSLRPQLR